jgi:CRP/FNR family transcriptional regulator, anaerobic regulatory protein
MRKTKKKRENDLMNAHLELREANSTPAAAVSCCDLCVAFDLNICLVASAAETSPPRSKPFKPEQSGHVVPARRIIWRENDLHDIVPVICTGWAAAIMMLSDGSRQIVSFLLPGDMISTTLLFDSRPYCQVEAVTDVRYRAFIRAELRSMLYKQPDLLEKFSKAWVDEKTRADQLIVDLGRRTAEERIARLILNLVDRLAKRGMVRGEPPELDFPLRQHHIADATGLTPVHVSKVLTEFRRNGLINISERSLTLLDPAGFRRVAHMR